MVNVESNTTRRSRGTHGERGASIIVVTVVLVVVLIGGLAAIAITSGQLSRTRGFRLQAADQACAEAGLQRLRASLPTVPDSFDATEGTVATMDGTLTYRAGHYSGDGAATIDVLGQSEFDASSLYVGENITNMLGSTGTEYLATGLNMLRITTVCGGPGYGQREVETILRYGTPLGAR